MRANIEIKNNIISCLVGFEKLKVSQNVRF